MDAFFAGPIDFTLPTSAGISLLLLIVIVMAVALWLVSKVLQKIIVKTSSKNPSTKRIALIVFLITAGIIGIIWALNGLYILDTF